MNLMTVDGYHAKIEFNEETDQFRGEILGLSGGADFYGSNPQELRSEFKKSLDIFLEVCKERPILKGGQSWFRNEKHFSLLLVLSEAVAVAIASGGSSSRASTRSSSGSICSFSVQYALVRRGGRSLSARTYSVRTRAPLCPAPQLTPHHRSQRNGN